MLQTVIPFVRLYRCIRPGPSVPYPGGHPQLRQSKATPESPIIEWIIFFRSRC